MRNIIFFLIGIVFTLSVSCTLRPSGERENLLQPASAEMTTEVASLLFSTTNSAAERCFPSPQASRQGECSSKTVSLSARPCKEVIILEVSGNSQNLEFIFADGSRKDVRGKRIDFATQITSMYREGWVVKTAFADFYRRSQFYVLER